MIESKFFVKLAMSLSAIFYFKLVSPSRFLVSIKQFYFFSLVFNIITSAGKYSFSFISTTSPTSKSFHFWSL